MFKDYINAITIDIAKVLSEMTCLNIQRTIIKKEERPDTQYALSYAIKFKHLDKNINGAVYFNFNDVEVANIVAMSIANKIGASEDVAHRDDYLCEFMNTCVGKALTNWENMGFSACIEPPEIIENSRINTPFYGSKISVIALILDVSHLLFQVVFIDGSYDVLIGKKILVVDDSLMIRQLLVRKLTAVGFNVETAINGLDAIEKTKILKPELIIMDQCMPALSGLDAIIEIRKFKPDMKIIMLSSSTRKDELNTAATLKVLNYLTKPISLPELYTEIAKALMNLGEEHTKITLN